MLKQALMSRLKVTLRFQQCLTPHVRQVLGIGFASLQLAFPNEVLIDECNTTKEKTANPLHEQKRDVNRGRVSNRQPSKGRVNITLPADEVWKFCAGRSDSVSQLHSRHTFSEFLHSSPPPPDDCSRRVIPPIFTFQYPKLSSNTPLVSPSTK
jgi:hypothetical protein